MTNLTSTILKQLGVQTPDNPLNGFRRIEGIAAFNDRFQKEGKGLVRKVTMQIGPLAPTEGDMLLLDMVGNKRFEVVGFIPAEVVKQYDIRPGDHVSGFSTGTRKVRLSASIKNGEVDLPTIDPTASLAGRLGARKFELLINGQPPRPRIDWRQVDPERVHYPDDMYDLGDDPNMATCQVLQLLGGGAQRGGKHLIPAEAGAGKSRLLLDMLRGIVENHRAGNRIHLVLAYIGERSEDTGRALRALRQLAAANPLVEIELINADTDQAMDLYAVARVGMIAAARAQRLAEHYATQKEPVDVILAYDSGVRLMRTFDMLKVGGKTATLPGGRDPFSLLIAQAIIQTGRAQVVDLPNGEQRVVYLTTFVTLLLDPGRNGDQQIADWAGDVTALIPLRPRTENRTILAGGLAAWERVIFREPENYLPPLLWAGIRKLSRELKDLAAETRRYRRPNDPAVPTPDEFLLEQLYQGMGPTGLIPNPESGGRAKAVLKARVSEQAFPVELDRARRLIRQGTIPGNELNSIDQLVDTLVILRSWGPRIWQQLAREGLVWPVDYLRAKDLFLSGKLHEPGMVAKPRDFFHQLREGMNPTRAQEIWEELREELGDEVVPSLYWVAWFLIEAGDKPESPAQLAEAMGITREWAQPIWEWLTEEQGYAPPLPEEEDEEHTRTSAPSLDPTPSQLDPTSTTTPDHRPTSITAEPLEPQPEPEPAKSPEPEVQMPPGQMYLDYPEQLAHAKNRREQFLQELEERRSRGEEIGLAGLLREYFGDWNLSFRQAKRMARELQSQTGKRKRRRK